MKGRLSRFVWTVAVTTLLVGFIVGPPAIAMEGVQSPYLKGYRDFLTGVLPSQGLQVRYDTYIYNGTERSTIPQGQLHVSLRAVTNILGATYVTPFQILGGDYAFSVRGAYSDLSADQSLGVPRFGRTITVARSGGLEAFNDVVVTPFIVGWHSGYWHWNWSTSVWMPVGAYDKTRLVNTGRNVWAFSPQLGVTYLNPNSGWEISGAAVHVVNASNPDTNYRSGDMVHLDFSAGKMLTPQFKFGLVGYYAQQITGDSGAGAIFGDRKIRVLGAGPGATYTFVMNDVPVTLVAKYYREFDAQNTTQGDAGSLSARIKF